jgi:hypothetical protein
VAVKTYDNKERENKEIDQADEGNRGSTGVSPECINLYMSLAKAYTGMSNGLRLIMENPIGWVTA